MADPADQDQVILGLEMADPTDQDQVILGLETADPTEQLPIMIDGMITIEDTDQEKVGTLEGIIATKGTTIYLTEISLGGSTPIIPQEIFSG